MQIKTLLRLSCSVVATLLSYYAGAQTPTYIYAGGSSNNSWPFNAGASGSNKVQWVYQPSQFSPTLPAGIITHVYFRTNTGAATRSFTDMRISLNTANFTTFPNGTYVTGMHLAYGPQTTTINVPSSGWFGVQLDTPFVYDGTSSLIIEATSNNANGVTVAQETSNGTRRIYGNVNNSTGTANTGLSACGLEVITCSTAITKQPVPATVCENKQAVFSVNAIDVAGYQWQVDEGNGFQDINNNSTYSGAGTNTLTISNVPYSYDGYQYRCKALNGSCSDSSNGVMLSVNGLVKLDKMPSFDTTCINAVKSFQVNGTGSITNYRWQIYSSIAQDYIDVPHTPPYLHMGNVLQISGVGDTLQGSRYRCIVTGVCDSSVSSSTFLVVLDVPKVAISPKDVNAQQGETVSFEVQASQPNARYQWQVADPDTFVNINEGGIYTGAKSNKLVVRGVSRIQDKFKFRCVVSTSSACIAPGDTSNFGVLYVEPPASVATIGGSNEVILYPNPVSSELNIRTSFTTTGIKYTITDKAGRTVMVGNLDASTITRVDVSKLPADIYLVKLVNEQHEQEAILRFTKL